MQHGMSYLYFTILLKSAANPACQIDDGCQLWPGLTPPLVLWHREGGTMAT